MAAFNAIRFKVKPGRDEEFLQAHQNVERDWPGLERVNLIQTGEHNYCIIGEWADIDSLAAARPHQRHRRGAGRGERGRPPERRPGGTGSG